MKVVILAAGLGKRLGSLNEGKPKALFQFVGRCLIDHTLDQLNKMDIEEIIVVGGYNFSLLQEYLQKCADRNLRLIENKNFEAGNIVTLAAARPFLNADFLILNSDHLYPEGLLEKILNERQGLEVICDRERPLGPDDMKVRWNESWQLKAIGKDLSDYQGGYIGITLCLRDMSHHYWDAFDSVLCHRGEQAVVEEVPAELTRKGTPPLVRLIDPIPWIEIDTPEDVAVAEEKVRKGLVRLSTP